MADQGALVGNPEAVPNLPKQHLARRQVKKTKSMIQLLLFNNSTGEDDIKSKNIKQTEILVDLREAIMQVYCVSDIVTMCDVYRVHFLDFPPFYGDRTKANIGDIFDSRLFNGKPFHGSQQLCECIEKSKEKSKSFTWYLQKIILTCRHQIIYLFIYCYRF